MQLHPMPEFGSFSLLLALVLSIYTLVMGGVALYLPHSEEQFGTASRLGETARRAGIASFIATSCAAFALVWASYTCDYSVSYILHHTNRALWWPYKFSAVWSGQEGSLLLWAFLLSAYGFVLRVRHRVDVRLTAFASTILAGIQVFFLTMVTMPSTTHPFAIEPGPLHADGFGLSPLLQYAEMMIHPPMLYLGYVGFSVPFAFALGALMMRYPGEKWIHITRRWTMVTWMFLTVGIFLGAHWAYSVLGWGGYWGWDPVENASLMPWLTGTAFLHSVMMQEKRGMMKTWNVWLIFCTFMLTILGTLLTRSGLVQSVHAFAQSNIGDWFYGFLLITFAVCLFAFFRNRDHLKSENKLESLVSRESSFLFNNLILLVACFTVLWGTLFPVLSEYVTGTKATVNAPYYNRVNVPIGLFLLFLTGVGPLLAWRSTSLRSIRRNFILPGIAFAVTAVVLMLAGIRPWLDGDDMHATLFSLMTLSLAAGVITAIASEFLRGANVVRTQTGKNFISATLILVQRNTRRYGGYVVHFGIVVMFIGIAGGAFNQNHEMEMGFGDSVQMGTYRLVCQSFSQDSNPNYETEYALLDVYKNGKKITQLAPEHRFYIASQQPSTIVAIHSTLQNDLYVVYEGKNPDTDKPIIKVFLNPLMSWIWIGVGIVVAGTLLGLAPNLARSAFKTPAVAPQPPLMEAEVHHV
jgi:cytochrome c-type biogenesis protein CcmF